MRRNSNMLMNISSKYILRNKIFPMLTSGKKLNLICYNKCLQIKLGVDIENYKRESRKRTGYGEIYISNENILLFEGEFVNGKKNGIGKNIMKMVI